MRLIKSSSVHFLLCWAKRTSVMMKQNNIYEKKLCKVKGIWKYLFFVLFLGGSSFWTSRAWVKVRWGNSCSFFLKTNSSTSKPVCSMFLGYSYFYQYFYMYHFFSIIKYIHIIYKKSGKRYKVFPFIFF